MATALWQPSKASTPAVEPRSDRMWGNTSFFNGPAQPASPPAAPASLLWKKSKPAAPSKPESLRAPGLWRSSSFSPETSKRIVEPSRRMSRAASPAPRAAPAPAAPSKRTSWVSPLLPSYVGRTTHYRNSHSVWAETMFQQRRHSVNDKNWIESVLPSYVKAGPYRTTHAIWAEKMFNEQRLVVLDGSWVEESLPSYVKVGAYETTYKSWIKTARAHGANVSWTEGVLPTYVDSGAYETSYNSWIKGARANGANVSWIEGVLPTYVDSGAYETSYAAWVREARANGANLSWIEGVLPTYISSGPYRTSHQVWLDEAPRLGADICWVDDVLPSYVNRSRSYKTTHDTWTEEFGRRRQSVDTLGRSHSMPPAGSPVPSGACSPIQTGFHSRKPSSFLQHRMSPTSQHTHHATTVPCYPPGSLSRTGSSMTAHEEPVPLSSMLSPPTVQNAINGIKTPASARFAALQSPCLFHKRFDDAVNLEKVLEEIEEEDGYSSGRLSQTATSVREINKQLQRKPIKRAVRNIMIVTKARDNSLVYLTRDLALWLMSTPRYGSKLGVNVYVDAKLKTSKRFDAASIVAQNPAYASMLRYWDPDLCWSKPESFDLVLTLGGDGTVLFTSFSLFQRVVPPVLAFGLGSLGFLTPFKFQEYKTSLNKIMGDAGMRVNLRMRVTCTVVRAPQEVISAKGAKARKALPSPVDTTAMVEGEQFEVLNELVIDRGPSPYVSNLELYADDEPLTVVQADGCIFSTPTGSTAYSLSAGGPLTHPNIPGLILTPICPHTLSFRPMVLSDTLSLKVCLPRDSRSTAYASFDGKHRVELRRGDCVRVEVGRYPFPTVVGDEGTGGEWFNSVRRALRWNTRGAMQKAFSSGGKKAAEQMLQQPSGARFDTSEDHTDELARAAIAEEDDEDEDEEEMEEETEWDIDFAPIKDETPGGLSAGVSVVDSGSGLSDAGSQYSPTKKGSISGPVPERSGRAVGFDGLFGGKMQQVRQGLGASGSWFPAFDQTASR